MAKKGSSAGETVMLMGRDWSVPEVATWLDTAETLVTRWCTLRMIAGARLVRGAWVIPGRGLFLFCRRRIEPHYSMRSAAELLDFATAETIETWIEQGRLATVKLGTAKSAPVRIPESEIERLLKAGRAPTIRRAAVEQLAGGLSSRRAVAA